MALKKQGGLGPHHVTRAPMTPAEKLERFGDLRRGAVPGRLLPSARRPGPRPIGPPPKR